jgi:hypothetical protein
MYKGFSTYLCVNVRRKNAIITLITIAAIFSAGGMYVSAGIIGPQTVTQTDPDKANCRQGNILDGVWGQVRFTVLSTCEKVVGKVHDMKGTREDDGDYQFNLALEEPFRKLLNEVNNNRVNGMAGT